MATIFDASTKYRGRYIGNPWRDNLLPASFRNAQFHCEAHALESGRRMVQHQFPKRDRPYAEDLGHQAISWSVRAYCITYPANVPGSDLYQRDYRTARDALVRVLSDGQPGMLQVQTMPPFNVWCQRFRLSEEERLGGYCTFDITFIESGQQTFPLIDTRTTLINTSTALRQQVLTQLWDIAARTTLPTTAPQIHGRTGHT